MSGFLERSSTQAILQESSFIGSSLRHVQEYLRIYSQYNQLERPLTLFYAIDRIRNIVNNDIPFRSTSKKLFAAFKPEVNSEYAQLKPIAVNCAKNAQEYRDDSIGIIGQYCLGQLGQIYAEENWVENFNEFENKALLILISSGDVTTERALEVRTEVVRQLNLLFATGANNRGEGYSTFQFTGYSGGFSFALDFGKLVAPAGFTAEVKVKTQGVLANSRMLLVDRLNAQGIDGVQSSGGHSIYCLLDLVGTQAKFSAGISATVGLSAEIPGLDNLPQTMDLATLSMEASASVSAEANTNIMMLTGYEKTPFYYNRIEDLSPTLVDKLGLQLSSEDTLTSADNFVNLWSTGFDYGLQGGVALEGKIACGNMSAGASASATLSLKGESKQTQYRYQVQTNESQTGSEHTKTQDTSIVYKQAGINAQASAEVFGEFGTFKRSASKEVESDLTPSSLVVNNGLLYSSSVVLWQTPVGSATTAKCQPGSGYIVGHSMGFGVLQSLANPNVLKGADKLIAQLAGVLHVTTEQLTQFFKSSAYTLFATDVFVGVNESIGAAFLEASFSAPKDAQVSVTKCELDADIRHQVEGSWATSDNLESIRVVLFKQDEKSSGFIKSLGLSIGPIKIGFDIGKVEDAGSHETIDLFNYWFNDAAVLNDTAITDDWKEKIVVRPKVLA